MALPNSYYSWVYQLLWGLKYFLVSLGTRGIVDKEIGPVGVKWYSRWLGTKGPYLLLHFEYVGNASYPYGNVCEIIVDGETITRLTQGDYDGMVLASNENYIGRDGTWQPFILATKTLEIKMRSKVINGGGNVAIKIMRFGE